MSNTIAALSTPAGSGIGVIRVSGDDALAMALAKRFRCNISRVYLIFDLVVPFEMHKSEDELRENVQTIVKTIDENYYSVINIDKSYV